MRQRPVAFWDLLNGLQLRQAGPKIAKLPGLGPNRRDASPPPARPMHRAQEERHRTPLRCVPPSTGVPPCRQPRRGIQAPLHSPHRSPASTTMALLASARGRMVGVSIVGNLIHSNLLDSVPLLVFPYGLHVPHAANILSAAIRLGVVQVSNVPLCMANPVNKQEKPRAHRGLIAGLPLY